MGKKLSLVSKALSLVFVVAMYVAYIVKVKSLPSADEAWGIVQVGIFVACVFVPVDMSLITKNIRGEK